MMRNPIVWRQEDDDKVCDENMFTACVNHDHNEYKINETNECV